MAMPGRTLGSRIAGATALGLALAAPASLLGCQAAIPVVVAAFGIDQTPRSLYEPAVVDWSTQRISGTRVRERRDAWFKTMAFPAQSANWSVGATAGLALTAFGVAAGDSVPNGPAVAYQEPNEASYGKTFFLTRAGKLVKIDRSTGAGTRWDVPGGKTFSRTNVTLSPRGSRAYLLADDGTLFIVNTATMATAATIPAIGLGYGIAPWIDPYVSRSDDTIERLYIASNSGSVSRYDVAGTTVGAVTSVSAATTYNIATGVTPLYSGTRKIAASPVVLNGVILIGDMAGNFYKYDTVNAANNLTYTLGQPITTSSAVEIQDGSYSLTDPAGVAKAVGGGEPVHAFVSAGVGCAWLNLHDASITRSQSLRIDDNDNATFGSLRTYNFSTAGTTEYLAAQDGGNINTESPNVNLPGTSPAAIWRNDFLIPAETNTDDDGGNPAEPIGGPVISYMRWSSPSSYPAGTALIASATLTLSPAADQGCRVPELRSTSAFYQGSASLWASNLLTNANRPLIGTADVGIYQSGGVNGQGNVAFRSNRDYVWDVTGAFTTPPSNGKYALALQHDAGGDAVLWPDGPVGGAVGKKAKRATLVEAVMFRNNPLNANPAAGTSNDTRPLLTLLVSNTVLPTPSIETPPFIDAFSKKCYVYYTNAVFELDWSAPEAFSDTGATATTKFQRAWHGVPGNNATGVGGRQPGGTHNNRTRFIGNYTAPTPAIDLTSLFVLSRTPTTDGAAPTLWNYAFSKITLPLNAGASTLVAGSPTFTSLTSQAALTGAAGDREASTYMAVDPYSGLGKVYFGLANGRVYQYDR